MADKRVPTHCLLGDAKETISPPTLSAFSI